MALPMQASLYIGTFVHTPNPTSLAILHNTIVGVDEHGKICFIEADLPQHVLNNPAQTLTKHGWDLDTTTLIKASTTTTSTSFFFPGFIDTHTHASQYPNTGIFGSSTLLDWLNTYTFPLESSYTSLSRACHVYHRVVARTLSHGTTCAAYYATVHVEATNLLADICFERGQRALVGRVCMDRMSPAYYRDASAESAVRDTEAVVAHIQQIDPSGELVRPVITPRFAPSCTEACLQGLGRLHAETSLFVQTHIAENKAEIALVAELFPAAKNYASVYDEAGLLTERTILAHAVHLAPDEVELIQQRKAKISHCPVSNTCLTSGAAKVRELWDAGITVGLGTDMSGGYSPSMLEMARQALLVSRHVAMLEGDSAKLSVAEVLYLATGGGAKVVGLDHKVGSFEVGLDWDAQMITLDLVREDEDNYLTNVGPVDIFGWESWDDRVAKWLYGGDDRNVQTVWVKGRKVYARS